MEHNTSCEGRIDFQQFGNIENYFRQCLSIDNETEMFQVLQAELSHLRSQNKLKSSELIILLIVNASLIIFGAFGASFLIVAVIRKPRMRTSRNLFTVNLAFSDLTLCLFTQPFNLLRTLHWHYEWQFGEVMCKFTSFAQATNVFVATISITAIALDRFHVIVYPLQARRSWHRPEFVLPGLWFLAFIMATPMLAFSTVTTGLSIDGRRMCSESTLPHHQLHQLKYIYGVFTVIFQYFVPFVILVAVYVRICTRIKQLARVRNKLATNTHNLLSLPKENTQSNLMIHKEEVESIALQSASQSQGPIKQLCKQPSIVNSRKQRNRRTNILLTSVALMFAISWLPLNVVNVVMDYKELHTSLPDGKFNFILSSTNQSLDIQTNLSLTNIHPSQYEKADVGYMSARSITLIQSFCLLCVLLSCCGNPVLYGYLNDNFKNEFKEMLCFKKSGITS